jgi:predicted PurR-regulated permease PerM
LYDCDLAEVNFHSTNKDYIPRMKYAPVANTTTSDRLTTVLSYGALLLLGYLVFRIFEPFMVPLAWSAVLAIFFYPLHERMTRKMKLTWAALASTLAVTLLLIVPTVVVLIYAGRQAIEAMARVQNTLAVHGQGPDQDLIEKLQLWLTTHLPKSWESLNLSDQLRDGVEKAASILAARAGSVLRNVASFFVDLFILIFALFFMFRDGQDVVRGVRHLLPFDEAIQKDMMNESKELIFASVAVGLLIAVIQGALGGLAFEITRIPSPLFWGMLIAFCSLVPVVGSALIWGPAALWLGFSGYWGKAFAVVAICGGVATVVDNLVRPLLLRNRTHLNELLLFIGVLGGLEVFGLLGLVVGPTILAAAMGVFRVYMDHRDEVEARETAELRA